MSDNCPKCGALVEPGKVDTGWCYKVEDGKQTRVCYECTAKLERTEMLKEGRATLYLTKSGLTRHEVTNYTGLNRFRVHRVRTSRHNIAGERTDVWFRGPENTLWWGVQYGHNTQIVRCKRIAEPRKVQQ